MCVCVLVSGESLTVFYIVPRWQELCLQFFHLVAPFGFHLGQKGTESIPLSNSASEQLHTENGVNTKLTTQKTEPPQTVFTRSRKEGPPKFVTL